LNHLRHKSVERGVLQEAAGTEEETEASAAGSAAGPEENAARRQLSDRLGRALATLPDNQRLAFTLKYAEELTAEEVAEAMGAPKNTVKTWLLRAREALRKELPDDL
jgi:RNA polymerase sigma-70 factor (ECF subfamily)